MHLQQTPVYYFLALLMTQEYTILVHLRSITNGKI